jgi:hypothetical protein
VWWLCQKRKTKKKFPPANAQDEAAARQLGTGQQGNSLQELWQRILTVDAEAPLQNLWWKKNPNNNIFFYSLFPHFTFLFLRPGRIFCGHCCKFKIDYPEKGFTTSVPACEECREKIAIERSHRAIEKEKEGVLSPFSSFFFYFVVCDSTPSPFFLVFFFRVGGAILNLLLSISHQKRNRFFHSDYSAALK